MKKIVLVIVCFWGTLGYSKDKVENCPTVLTDMQIQHLRTFEEVTIDNVTYKVDGDSRLTLATLKASDFSESPPFQQKQGRTINCWLKLKGENKHFGLREK